MIDRRHFLGAAVGIGLNAHGAIASATTPGLSWPIPGMLKTHGALANANGTHPVFTADVRDYGARLDHMTDDTAALDAACAKAGSVLLPAQHIAAIMGVVGLPSGTALYGTPTSGGFVLRRSDAFIALNANTSLMSIRVQSRDAKNAVVIAANSSDVLTVFLHIDSQAEHAGNGIFCSAPGCGDHRHLASTIRTTGYGILYDRMAGGMKNLLIDSADIISANADAIAINSPEPGVRGRITGVTITNSILAALSSGQQPEAGFGISIAHAANITIANTVVTESRKAAVHIEDASQRCTINGVVADNCQGNGIECLVGYASTDGDGSAAGIIGCQLHAPQRVAGTAGVWLSFDRYGSYDEAPITANVISGFESGLFLAGNNTVHAVDGNTLRHCTYGLRIAGPNVVVSGTNVADGVDYLVRASGTEAFAIRVGSFICKTKPRSGIVLRDHPSSMPAVTLEGFAWPDTMNVDGQPSTQWHTLFSAPQAMDGRLRVTIGEGGAEPRQCVDFGSHIYWDGNALHLSESHCIVEQPIKQGSILVKVEGDAVKLGFICEAPRVFWSQISFSGHYSA
ncbi:MAG TPA: right-handed parallel beta-helix repeat-containing protein [Gemmatimonadaceae bacterium]|nr:right-handed parallel beta-helix repeat-containing protein [Gemmatimonadaceae bacterium]